MLVVRVPLVPSYSTSGENRACAASATVDTNPSSCSTIVARRDENGEGTSVNVESSLWEKDEIVDQVNQVDGTDLGLVRDRCTVRRRQREATRSKASSI